MRFRLTRREILAAIGITLADRASAQFNNCDVGICPRNITSLAEVPMPSPAGFDVLMGPDGAYLLGSDGAYLLGPSLPSSQKSAIVSVDLATLGATIPADFVGISAEVGDLIKGSYQGTTGSAASYIGLLSLLGSSGKFRIGGGSSDSVTPPALTQAIANNLASFVTALGAGWTVVYGLDLVANDSATAATQAGFMNTALGTKVAFQMGNEPFTSGNFSVGSYQTAWNAYYTAITAAVPSAKFDACDDNNQTTTQTAIPGLTPGLAGLTGVTAHYYSGAAGAGINDWPALLAALKTGTFNSLYTYASGSSKPVFMSEANSLSFGGQVGVSDRLMAQAWFINLAITLAKIGWAGFCVQSTFSYAGQLNGVYNPLVKQANGNFKPSPIFYGMYLFSRLAGRQLAASTQGGTANINSIAVKQANGQAAILVVNNDATETAIIKPMQSAAWTTANVLLSRDSDGVGPTSASLMLGGAAIGESGSWSGVPFIINSGDTVAIPPCGAALILIQ